MADKQINELTVATDISDATTFPANNNTPTYEAQQVSVGQIANFIGARANAMHNIGDVFTNKSSKVELNPGCVPLWTGEYITNAKNIYPEFYNYLKVQNPGICISKQEYDTQVSSGECRYFVIDEEDGSIRFPKYNFVEPDYPYIYVFNASIPQSTSQGAEYTSALVSKVSKAGDTMTGSLAVKVNGNGLSIRHPEADITTTPTEDKYNSIYFTDKNGRYGGVFDHCFKANGTDYVRLLVCKNDGSNSTIRGLEILQKAENNNESWANFSTDKVIIKTPDNAQNTEATNAKWVISKFVDKSGDTMTGALKVPTPSNDSNDTTVPTTAWVTSKLSSVSSGGSKSIGEVFYSQSNNAEDNPGSLPLWTGEYYSNASSLYPDFYSWVKSHTELCKTKQQYDDAVNTYGECPYYVIDEVSGSLRLPKLTNYIKMADSESGLTQSKAGLPNITGTFSVVGENYTEALSGAFSDGGLATKIAAWDGSNKRGIIRFSAEDSSSIYGASDTVPPAHTTLYPWVYAFNSAVSASVAQAAEFTGALIGKAATDLSNGTKATQANINNIMPDAMDYVVDSYSDDAGNWYRVYKSGWVEQGGIRVYTGLVGEQTVTLLKPMANANYSLMPLMVSKRGGADQFPILTSVTTTTFKFNIGNALAGVAPLFTWRAEGYKA